MSGMEWTPETVREQLPDVEVLIGKGRYRATVTGRMNRFATVHIERVPGVVYSADWAWDTIANCLNNGRPLIY